MEANGQTLYNDDLLNILPDGVIILDINREVIQLNQQAFTELHVHSSVNAMMPLPTNKIFKLLNKKEDNTLDHFGRNPSGQKSILAA